ncbi:MAG: hypothetical protein U0840_13095 [Gemmataceae bacterium]
MRRARGWVVVALGLGVSMIAAGCSPRHPSSGSTRSGGAASSARAKGASEAAVAIAAGTIKLKEYPPLPSPPHHGEYVKLLREKCKVEYEVPTRPPGISEQEFTEEVRGWNDSMEMEIKKRFGGDILQRLQAEAHQRWQDQLKPGARP